MDSLVALALMFFIIALGLFVLLVLQIFGVIPVI